MTGALPLLQPESLDLPARVTAMLNALVQQRNQTADEVVNLCGDLADAREKIATLEKRIAELELNAKT
jgi:hypothetical protein